MESPDEQLSRRWTQVAGRVTGGTAAGMDFVPPSIDLSEAEWKS